MTIEFSPEKLAKVNEIIARYPEGKQKSALIPVLHLAQDFDQRVDLSFHCKILIDHCNVGVFQYAIPRLKINFFITKDIF